VPESVLPALPSRVGKKGILIMPPDGKQLRFTVIDEIVQVQSDLPSKQICLQRVRFEDGREEVRLGYYIIGKKPRMKDKWVWGQYATFLPMKDFKYLVAQAQRRRWFVS
jgi:hypothetical protein